MKQFRPSCRFISSSTKLLIAAFCIAAWAGFARAAALLYVSDGANGQIDTVSSAGIVTAFATLAAGSQPGGLAVDAAGNVFVANGDRVDKVTPTGVVRTFASGLSTSVNGVAFDAAGNLLASSDGGTIYKITSVGAVSTFATQVSFSPSGFAVAPGGDVYVADQIGKVAHFSATGTLLGRIGTNTRGAADVKFGPDGNLYTTSYEQGQVNRITLSGVETTFTSGLGSPANLAFDQAGDLFVTDLNGTVFRIDSNGTAVPFTTLPGVYGVIFAVPEPGALGTIGVLLLMLRRRSPLCSG